MCQRNLDPAATIKLEAAYQRFMDDDSSQDASRVDLDIDGSRFVVDFTKMTVLKKLEIQDSKGTKRHLYRRMEEQKMQVNYNATTWIA